MAVNSTTAASGYSTAQLTEASRAVTNELGQDAFLKLLIAELSNQDPLNPMSDREFIAQMAQFTSLEQMTQLNKTLQGMASLDKYSAVNYVGTTVYFHADDANGTSRGYEGFVDKVWYDPDEGPILNILGFGEIPLSQIEGVTYTATDTEES